MKKQLKKSKLKFFCVPLVIVFLLISIFGINKNIKETSVFYKTVVIDAGHGGVDVGAVGSYTGAYERDINLAISLFLKNYLDEKGIKVVLTRKNSGGLYGVFSKGHKKRDMKKRKEIINNCSPDVVISIHQNKFSSPLKRGCQLYIKDGDERSEKLCEIIGKNLKNERGLCNILSGDFYILNVSPCPAVIVECGFLSNVQDEKLLIDESFQKSIAQKIGSSILEFLLSE